MAFASVFLILGLLAVPAVYGVDHNVGGSGGWTLGGSFGTWAAGEKFVVGDNLIFTYGSSHSVEQVSQSDYNSCATGNAINTYSSSPTTVPLKSAGTLYFLCPTVGHCGGGMKLSVTVSAASTPSTPTPTTPSTPTPTTPSTPTPPKEGIPPASPGTPSPPKESPSGAVGSFSDMNKLVVGVSIVVAGLVGLMG